MTHTFTTHCGYAGAMEKPSEDPFVLEFFMVECTNFRGMAFRDSKGRWRNAQTEEELSGKVVIVE